MEDLSPPSDEIYAITHYELPKKQLVAPQALGIPAQLRKIDNTVCVLPAYLRNPGGAPAAANAPRPKRKSASQ